jgi:predicted transcriptional regulator of viral defense system
MSLSTAREATSSSGSVRMLPEDPGRWFFCCAAAFPPSAINMRYTTFCDILRLLIFELTVSYRLSTVIDDAERTGRLTLTTDQLAQMLPGLSAKALQQALFRLQRRGRLTRVARGAGQWVVVPLMHAATGAPPLETWLHRFLITTLKEPYYVGLLSAAETYGVSPYATTVTQVMVPRQRRPITVGRQRIVFHTRANITGLPTRWHETNDGRFLISTPELTLLDLIRRQDIVGGLGRAIEVLSELAVHATADGLTTALDAAHDVPNAQRLGALLASHSAALAETIAEWLDDRSLRTIRLSPMLSGPVEEDKTFRVMRPTHLQAANT